MANKWTGSATSNGGEIVGIPENILKIHTNDLLFEAMPVMKYDQFCVVKTDLQKSPGDTIVFSKYANLEGGGAIAEDADIELKATSKTTVSIAVTEYANGVGITGKFMSQSFIDDLAVQSVLLGRNYARIADDMLRNALFSLTQVYYAGNQANRNAIQNTNILRLDDIDACVEDLATGNVVKYVDANGEYYIGVFHPHQIRGIKKELIPIKQYAYPEAIFKGEVGMYNGVRFIETANVPNGAAVTTDSAYLAALKKSATPALTADYIYKGVIFGERTYGWAVALPVELREDPGYSNFGRKRGLAWYSIMGAGKIVNENGIVVESA